MKLTVIGHWGGFPAKDGATSCYLVEKNNFSLLLDIGSGALAKLQKYTTISDIDAVILSHYHHDHMADVGVLQYARVVHYYVTGEQNILPIYGHKENEEKFTVLTHDFTEGIAYNPNQPLQIGPFTITFLKTNHPVPCYGMKITDGESTFVYTADTAYQESWIPFVKGADMIITDCNLYADQDGTKAGHMTSKEGAIIAKEAGVDTLILSHLPQFGDQYKLVAEANEHFNGDIQLAYEGLVWQR